MTKFAGVPETVVTVPLPKVVERKSNVSADAEIVNALDATEAEIGCICDPRLKVPVASGSVNVRLLAEFGAAMVNTPAPLAFPEMATELMFYPLNNCPN
jgi:hypothetical protein